MTYLARIPFAIAWWIVSIGWLLGIQPMVNLPWWLIVLGHVLLVVTLRRPQKLGQMVRQTSGAAQVLDYVAVALCMAGGVFFALTSGFVTEGVFTLNSWSKASAVVFCCGLMCVLAAYVMDGAECQR